MFVLRSIALLSLLSVFGIGCRGPAAEAESDANEPAAVNPVVYLRFSIETRELAILWNRPSPDSDDVRVRLRGRAHNTGEHDVVSLEVSYECDPDHYGVKGTVSLGPIPHGESIQVDEVITTLNLPSYTSYRCKVEPISVTF